MLFNFKVNANCDLFVSKINLYKWGDFAIDFNVFNGVINKINPPKKFVEIQAPHNSKGTIYLGALTRFPQ